MSIDSVRRRDMYCTKYTRIRTHQTNERKKYSKLITVWVSFANEQQHEQFHFGPFYFRRENVCVSVAKSKLISWKPSTAGCENHHTHYSQSISKMNDGRKKKKIDARPLISTNEAMSPMKSTQTRDLLLLLLLLCTARFCRNLFFFFSFFDFECLSHTYLD